MYVRARTVNANADISVPENQKKKQNDLRLFDTAETYGSGLSEKIVGDLVRSSPLRNEIFVATKFQPGKWVSVMSRYQSRRQQCSDGSESKECI